LKYASDNGARIHETLFALKFSTMPIGLFVGANHYVSVVFLPYVVCRILPIPILLQVVGDKVNHIPKAID
jgi:hypothetical protein